ncbi:MAG: ATP-binding protein [Bacilli bacterium]|nr:ATP-binding protein [Bacilli bacterium]
MLKEITISNFKSIKDEVTLSMEADLKKVSEHKDHIKLINDNNLLRVMSMYGPNGGGKTNIIKGLMLLKEIVLGVSKFLPAKSYKCEYSNNDIITLTPFFVSDNYEIGYELKFTTRINEMPILPGQNGFVTSYDIVGEEIVYRKKGEDEYITLAKRDSETNIEGSITKLFEQKILPFAKNKSFVSKMFEDYANNDSPTLPEEFVVLRQLYSDISRIYYLDAMVAYSENLFNYINENKDKLIKSLNNVDIPVSDIIISKSYYDNIFIEREVKVNNEIKKYRISLNEESNGSKKMFWILLNLINNLDKHMVFVCDDMNAYLHPKLYSEIIKLFNSDKNITSQLIFNSHDIINMNNSNFRRDEICFVYKNENYSTDIMPLSNIINYKGEQVRKDASYYKQYLEGRYGFDPFIKKGLDWND